MFPWSDWCWAPALHSLQPGNATHPQAGSAVPGHRTHLEPIRMDQELVLSALIEWRVCLDDYMVRTLGPENWKPQYTGETKKESRRQPEDSTDSFWLFVPPLLCWSQPCAPRVHAGEHARRLLLAPLGIFSPTVPERDDSPRLSADMRLVQGHKASRWQIWSWYRSGETGGGGGRRKPESQ